MPRDTRDHLPSCGLALGEQWGRLLLRHVQLHSTECQCGEWTAFLAHCNTGVSTTKLLLIDLEIRAGDAVLII
jgi:hypothetical protein